MKSVAFLIKWLFLPDIPVTLSHPLILIFLWVSIGWKPCGKRKVVPVHTACVCRGGGCFRFESVCAHIEWCSFVVRLCVVLSQAGRWACQGGKTLTPFLSMCVCFWNGVAEIILSSGEFFLCVWMCIVGRCSGAVLSTICAFYFFFFICKTFPGGLQWKLLIAGTDK